MSHQSHISRYRPAIFVITGAAAACGIYILYSTFASEPAKGSLHRSNAVHRPRRQPRLIVEYGPPLGRDVPLGHVLVYKGGTKFFTDVSVEGAPTAAKVKDYFPDVPEDQYPQSLLDSKAVESVMNACYLAQGNRQAQAWLAQSGADGISEAMEAGNIGRVLALATPLLHQIVTTDHETIQSAARKFLRDSDLDTHELSEPEISDIAETEDMSDFEDLGNEPEQGLKGLIYHIAETDAKRKAYEHRGIHCEECGEKPIRGIRWHCLNCPDYDLCSTCEANSTHTKTHVFVKIKIPLPVLSQPTQPLPLWYPGESRRIHRSLSAETRTQIKQQYDFDDAHMDAYFDQFTCLVNVQWKEDPIQVKAAINRQAFDKALTCERWPQRFRPNAVYDRMFAFYDTDSNGLIGFKEFLSGIAYLRGPKRFSPLRRALEGFDIDGDGYVDRKDFLRLLHAKYEIQQLLINDMVEAQERQQTLDAQDTLRSSQPISSIFSWEEIPQGEVRVSTGKARDVNGDLQPLDGTNAILRDDEGWSRERLLRQRQVGQPHEQLQHHLSRFEELLGSPTNGDQDHWGRLPQSGAYADDEAEDESLDKDALWQIVEDGFNEILDPMFKAKEDEHEKAIKAMPEIQRWRQEIDDAIKRKEELKKSLQEELEAADTVDPLLATAVNSLNGSVDVKPKEATEGNGDPAFKSEIVPTDHESLTKREEEIAEKPLNELLKATGYSAIEDNDGNGPPPSAANGHIGASANSTSKYASLEDSTKSPEEARQVSDAGSTINKPAEPMPDPTMPQNRPNSRREVESENENLKPLDGLDGAALPVEERLNPAVKKGTPPSYERLLHLGELAEVDKEIEARGGPGRLSFEEVEAMVQQDTKSELKGLVTGWLEWASF